MKFVIFFSKRPRLARGGGWGAAHHYLFAKAASIMLYLISRSPGCSNLTPVDFQMMLTPARALERVLLGAARWSDPTETSLHETMGSRGESLCQTGVLCIFGFFFID